MIRTKIHFCKIQLIIASILFSCLFMLCINNGVYLTTYADVNSDYLTYSTQIKNIDNYPYDSEERAIVNDTIINYENARILVSTYDNLADAKLAMLKSQKIYVETDIYNTSANLIIDSPNFSENPLSAKEALEDYSIARQLESVSSNLNSTAELRFNALQIEYNYVYLTYLADYDTLSTTILSYGSYIIDYNDDIDEFTNLKVWIKPADENETAESKYEELILQRETYRTNEYNSASSALLDIESYEENVSLADSAMAEYVLAKANVSSYNASAESKFADLTIQKNNKVNYDNATDELLDIVNYEQDENASNLAINNYIAAKANVTIYSQTAETKLKTLQYGKAAKELKNLASYYEEIAQSVMDNYILCKAEVSSYDEMAEQQYQALSTQKTKKLAYESACTNLLSIVCYANDVNSAKTAMDNYILARNNVSVYNLVADNKYASLLNEKSNYKDTLNKPYPSVRTYTYNGREQEFILNGFDSETMTITNNFQTNANESGYVVLVSLKNKTEYKWSDETTNDLAYSFKIQKISYTEQEENEILFSSKMFLYTGEDYSIAISNLPIGINVEYLIVNGEIVNGHSFSASRAGKYDITAQLKADYNYKDLSNMQPTCSLVIRPLSIVAENNKAIAESSIGLDPTIDIEVDVLTSIHETENVMKNKSSLKNNEKISVVYDVSFMNNGSSLQPDNPIMLKLSIPENLVDTNFKVFHIHSNALGTNDVEEVEYTLLDDFIVFETRSLSCFAFVVEYTPVPPTSAGSNVAIIVLLTVSVMVVALFVLYFVWKYNGKPKKFLVPVFRTLNKMFCGSALNNIELAEKSKQLLEVVNKKQKNYESIDVDMIDD